MNSVRRGSQKRNNSFTHPKDGWLERRSKWIPIVTVASVAVIGALFIYLTKAATPAASLESDNGALSANVAKLTSGSASGGFSIKFKAPPVVVSYCGGRSFTAPAHCIGAAEWAQSVCTSLAACQASNHPCLAYMSGDTTKIYDMSAFGGHSGGADAVINPDICGKDFYNIINRTAADYDQGTVPNNSKHTAVKNRTQGTFNSLLTGSEYDSTKP